MSAINLLEETLGVLKQNNKTPEDVRWVGSSNEPWSGPRRDFVGPWSAFAALADFKYDNGFGGAEVNQRLKVVGDDWWLERGEYDGSEWWEFKTMPSAPAAAEPLCPEALHDR